MNKIYLIGNLTRDPELSETNSGIPYCRFSLAVNRTVGEVREADFYNVTAWRGQAETLARYVRKGQKLAIIGNIALRNYEGSDGIKRLSVDVTVTDFEFLTPKGDDTDRDFDLPPATVQKQKPTLEPFDSDDDSPF